MSKKTYSVLLSNLFCNISLVDICESITNLIDSSEKDAVGISHIIKRDIIQICIYLSSQNLNDIHYLEKLA